MPPRTPGNHCKNDGEKCAVKVVGQKIIQCRTGDQGKGKIDSRNQTGAQNIYDKQFFVVFKIAKKDPYGGSCLKIFGGHSISSLLLQKIISYFVKWAQ